MLIDGTRIAVGLPFTYIPDDFVPKGATDLRSAAHLATRQARGAPRA